MGIKKNIGRRMDVAVVKILHSSIIREFGARVDAVTKKSEVIA